MPAEIAPIWILLGQLADQAEAITVAGGYRTDLGLKVSREPAQLHAEANAPVTRLLVALASQVLPSNAGTQLRQLSFDVVLEAAVPCDSEDAQEIAHAALADLFDLHDRSRTYLQSSTISTQVTPGPGEVLTKPEGLPVIVASLTLRCAMTTKQAAPTVLPPIGPP